MAKPTTKTAKELPIDSNAESFSVHDTVLRTVIVRDRMNRSNRISLCFAALFLCLAISSPIIAARIPVPFISNLNVVAVIYSSLSMALTWITVWTYWKTEADWLTCERCIEALHNWERMFENLPTTPENLQRFRQGTQRIFDEMTNGLTSPMRIRLTGKFSPITQFLSVGKEDHLSDGDGK